MDNLSEHMSRVIKFRVRVGDVWCVFDIKETWPRPEGVAQFEGGEVDWDTLGQFCGLLDKNGKEIYEGDIIWAGKFDQHDGCKIVASVAWDETNRLRSAHKWYMGGYTLKLVRPTTHSISDFDNESKWEVIGNIYENPDLLKP